MRNHVRPIPGIGGLSQYILGLMSGLGHSKLSRPHMTIQDKAEQAGRMIIASLNLTK
jgi:hypothetical protein